jgi:thiosulfate/3-mercaptopyruvate sulfurtransferase
MNPLVSPTWLQSRLQQPGLVVLDATLPPVGVSPAPDVRARYLDQHIPGALYFDIEEFSDHATSLPHMLPSPEEFSRKAEALGIDSTAEIVIYEQDGVFSAPRAWWMFRTFGVEKVYLLDGGLPAWAEAGYPVISGPEHRAPAKFRAHFNLAAIVNYNQLQQSLHEHAQVLDARSAGRFSGTAPEPRPGLSSGHMPGATSLPFTELVADGKLLPPDRLRQTFATKGLDLEKPITTTCGSGVTAAVLALALEISGAKQVQLYDGSWAEYAQNPASIIDKNP